MNDVKNINRELEVKFIIKKIKSINSIVFFLRSSEPSLNLLEKLKMNKVIFILKIKNIRQLIYF